jgi:hypothetical protein
MHTMLEAFAGIGNGSLLPRLRTDRDGRGNRMRRVRHGPLLAEQLTDADLLTGAAVDAWLAETGWRPEGPWCPGCDRAHPGPRRTSRRSS